MAAQITALLVFTGVFVLATLRKVHLGIAMLAAAAAVGLWLGQMTIPEIIGGFPVSILVLLIGVTCFFGIANENGTIDLLITSAIRLVGDRARILPLVFFALTGGVAAMGSPLAGLVMAPIGMPLAKKYNIDRMLMGLAIGSGLSAGAFAPTSLFGIVTYGTAHSVGIGLDPLVLFAVALGTNLLLLVAAYLLFGGFKRPTSFATNGGVSVQGLRREPATSPPPTDATQMAPALAPTTTRDPLPAPPHSSRMSPIQRLTVACMIGLVLSVVVLSAIRVTPEIGLLCFAFAAVLALADPSTGKAAIGKADWLTMFMVCGIITFVGVLESMGAIDLLGDAASRVGTPLLAAFVICFMGGLISAFASTTGILAALVPLALPLVASGDLAGWAVIASLGVCSSIVDVSPFSTLGATLVASVEADERARMHQLLMRWGLSMVVVGPVLLVGVLVIPASL